MSETVLVPIDGSPLSYRALRHALEKFREETITVLYVSDVFDPGFGRGEDSVHEPMIGSDRWYAMEEEAAEQLLLEAEEIATEYDREVETDSEVGDPQRIIPDYAREENIDHVVIGVHGREKEERSMVGQVAETVLYRSPVSVTVVK